ncbi:hypothetical protein WA026_022187 [Henosepilachna vigintioctopunctata]|uniref:Uncharacterized protein n=1 Tax=Henosepilachna vigintioctopunctata TaxID=420089 RepID=A0AAW1TYD8_9CUCU
MTFRSTKDGEFWRILLPGKYAIEVTAIGYHDQIQNFIVKETEKNSCPEPTKLQILLTNSSIPRTTPSFKALRQGKSQKVENINIPRKNTVSYQAQRGPPTREKEGENFLRKIFENSELDVSRLTTKDIQTFLREDLSIPVEDIKTHFQEVIKNFDSKSPEEKPLVFVKIFDVLLDTPVKKTDTKWLIDYVNDVHITTGLRKDNIYFQRYNTSSEFGKIEIILLFNDLFEQKNHSGRLSVFSLLIISAFLMVSVWK